ncbi:MAG: hypothetical protein AB1724_00090 [Thermodesulfobacteriota bacterium]
MEIIVCILTTLFFAVMEIRDIKVRYTGMRHARIENEEFMLLPLYSDERSPR